MLLTLGSNEIFPDFYFNDFMIENLAEEKILGIVIENKLNLSLDLKYLNKICKKDKQKFGAFDNISKLTTLN